MPDPRNDAAPTGLRALPNTYEFGPGSEAGPFPFCEQKVWMPEERDASIKVRIGELVEIRKTNTGDGFILRDLSHIDHYFYYTADRRFATYDGWSATPEDAERVDPLR